MKSKSRQESFFGIAQISINFSGTFIIVKHLFFLFYSLNIFITPDKVWKHDKLSKQYLKNDIFDLKIHRAFHNCSKRLHKYCINIIIVCIL